MFFHRAAIKYPSLLTAYRFVTVGFEETHKLASLFGQVVCLDNRSEELSSNALDIGIIAKPETGKTAFAFSMLGLDSSQRKSGKTLSLIHI